MNRSSDFEKVKQFGKSYAGKNIVLCFLRLDEIQQESLKVAFIASRRLSNKAVSRNRAKRLMREAFRTLKSQLPDNLMLVLIGRKYILSSDSGTVQKDLIDLLRKASLWKE